MAIQPALGALHHVLFVKTQKRTVVSHVHIWYGRFWMVLGVLNGGFGLQLAREKDSLIIAYSVVAAITFLSYFLFTGFKGYSTWLRKEKLARNPKDEPIMPPPRRPYKMPRRSYKPSKSHREAYV